MRSHGETQGWRARLPNEGADTMSRIKFPHALTLGLVASIWSSPGWAQTTHTVTTVGNTFSPANVSITQGDSVMWTALQPFFHNVAETNCPANVGSGYNGGFRSGDPNAVPSFTQVFNTAGTFCYICEVHAGLSMFGSVTAKAVTVQTPLPSMDKVAMIGMAALLCAVGVWTVQRRFARPPS